MPTIEDVGDKPTSESAIVVASPLDVELVARAARLAERPRSAATLRAYEGDWKRWAAFCGKHGLSTLPAAEGAIVAHLAQLQGAGRRPATITRAYATIRARHLDAGRPLPTLPGVVNALANITRELGAAPHGKLPLAAERLKAVARIYDAEAEDQARSPVDRVLAVRDASMMLLTFAAARRRADVVALDVSDARFVEDGLVVQVRRSKTDQAGEGLPVGVAFGSSRATCPVRALRRWLELAGIVEGPIYRGVDRRGRVLPERLSGEGVSRAVKRAAGRLGLEPRDFGGHSLRSGFATSAAEAGKRMDRIMAQGGWQSDRTVRERYIKPASVFRDNASEGLL
jgi:integrase